MNIVVKVLLSAALALVLQGCSGNEAPDPQRLVECHDALNEHLQSYRLSERINRGQYQRYVQTQDAQLLPPQAMNSLVGYVLVGDFWLHFEPGALKARYTCQFQENTPIIVKFEHVYSEDIKDFSARFALENTR